MGPNSINDMNYIHYTFDIEDYYMATCFDNSIQKNSWNKQISKIELGTESILEFLSKHKIKATFFFLGYVAEKYPKILKKVHDNGHEIGCHGYNHILVSNFDAEQFNQDLKRATSSIEDVIGVKVIGYRAPTFSLDISDTNMVDILIQNGYKYNSGNFTGHWNQTNKKFTDFNNIFEIKEGLFELPMTSQKFFGLRFPIGGGYSRLYPTYLNKEIIKRQLKENHVILYFHPWEFLDIHPLRPKGIINSFKHSLNIGKPLINKLESIIRLGYKSRTLRDTYYEKYKSE